MATPTVTAVITTYNRGMDFLPSLLRSLADQTYRDQGVTVVVDGGDPDVLAYLEREWPAVEVLSMPEPQGYANAAALGMRSAGGRYIAILNDDVELEPGWLELLVAELERDPQLGFVTGKTLLYEERDVINETKQDLYTCGRFEPRGLLEKDIGQWDRREPTTIATAAASIYRREAVEAAGGLDHEYGFYCEDADLCLRMVLIGYRGLYIPEARAYHAWSATTGRVTDQARYLAVRNALTTLLKDMPAGVLIGSLPKIVLYQSHNLSIARGAGKSASRSVVRGWGGFLMRIPSTLRKRRAIMRRRAISGREFKSMLITEYPVPTGLSFPRTRAWWRHRLLGPMKRFAGGLLDYIPEPIRPRIRDRDRKGREEVGR
jgi:GT2 family glycosyltransferase